MTRLLTAFIDRMDDVAKRQDDAARAEDWNDVHVMEEHLTDWEGMLETLAGEMEITDKSVISEVAEAYRNTSDDVAPAKKLPFKDKVHDWNEKNIAADRMVSHFMLRRRYLKHELRKHEAAGDMDKVQIYDGYLTNWEDELYNVADDMDIHDTGIIFDARKEVEVRLEEEAFDELMAQSLLEDVKAASSATSGWVKKNASNIMMALPFVMLFMLFISVKVYESGPIALVGVGLGIGLGAGLWYGFDKLMNWADRVAARAKGDA